MTGRYQQRHLSKLSLDTQKIVLPRIPPRNVHWVTMPVSATRLQLLPATSPLLCSNVEITPTILARPLSELRPTGASFKLKYRINSKRLPHKMSRTFCHLLAMKMGRSKMAEVDEYLDQSEETLEWMVKCQSAFGDGHCLVEQKFIKSLLELRFKTVMLLDNDSQTPTTVKGQPPFHKNVSTNTFDQNECLGQVYLSNFGGIFVTCYSKYLEHSANQCDWLSLKIFLIATDIAMIIRKLEICQQLEQFWPDFFQMMKFSMTNFQNEYRNYRITKKETFITGASTVVSAAEEALLLRRT